MSDELVQRLRAMPYAPRTLRDEAAKRIQKLEDALTQISNYEVRPQTAAYELQQIARRALERK